MGPVGRVPPNFEGRGDQKYLVPPNLLQLPVFFRWIRRIATDDHVDRITFSAVAVSDSS